MTLKKMISAGAIAGAHESVGNWTGRCRQRRADATAWHRARFSTHNSSTGAAAADPVGAGAVLVDPAGVAAASVLVLVDPAQSGGAVRRRASSASASEPGRCASLLLAPEGASSKSALSFRR